MSGVEREFKLRIPGAERARALRARLGGFAAVPVLQENHFFDTATRALGAARLALRLRDEDGRFLLTLKGPLLAGEGSLAEREEEELAPSPEVARALLGGARCPLATLEEHGAGPLARRARACAGADRLQRLGSFQNERTRLGPLAFPPGKAGPALVFELDETRFPDGSVERELELELPAGARADELERALRELFASLGIPFDPAPSKAARFFRILEDTPR